MRIICLFLPGCEQEEHHGGGVMGRNQNKTVLHARHDEERLCFLHMGFPENQPTIRCKHKVFSSIYIIILEFTATANVNSPATSFLQEYKNCECCM